MSYYFAKVTKTSFLYLSCLLLSCCAMNRSQNISPGLDIQQASRLGFNQLKKGNYETASRYFAVGLKKNIRNCSLNFLNGLSYQMRGRQGDTRLLSMALAGYQNTMRVCPDEPWAYYYTGVLYYQQYQYVLADKYFKLAYEKSDKGKQYTTSFFKAYLVSAFKSGDVQGAKQALQVLEKTAPDSKLVKTVKRFYSGLAKPNRGYRKSLLAKKRNKQAGGEKQAVVDGVIIASLEHTKTRRGINLLDGLTLQYTGSFNLKSEDTVGSSTIGSTSTSTSTSTSGSESTSTLLNNFDLQSIQYDLNIFNDTDELDEILARPSIVASDGEEADFFSGQKLILGISGLGSTKFESFPVGTSLEVTPYFKGKSLVQLVINMSRETLGGSVGSLVQFGSKVSVIKQSSRTTVTLRFGQTLALSTLAINEAASRRSKVPLLGGIPVVNTLFKKDDKSMTQGSLLFLLTPRRIVSFDTSYTIPSQHELLSYYKGLISRNTNFMYNLEKLRVLSIYHFPLRLVPELYSKETFNRSITHFYRMPGQTNDISLQNDSSGMLE